MKGYRIFLVLLLLIAIGGGVWYCCHMYTEGEKPQVGTLVENCMRKCKTA